MQTRKWQQTTSMITAIVCQYVVQQRIEVWSRQTPDEAVAWRSQVSIRLCRREATGELSVRLRESKRNIDAVR